LLNSLTSSWEHICTPSEFVFSISESIIYFSLIAHLI
jgi:hypothetical protein